MCNNNSTAWEGAGFTAYLDGELTQKTFDGLCVFRSCGYCVGIPFGGVWERYSGERYDALWCCRGDGSSSLMDVRDWCCVLCVDHHAHTLWKWMTIGCGDGDAPDTPSPEAVWCFKSRHRHALLLCRIALMIPENMIFHHSRPTRQSRNPLPHPPCKRHPYPLPPSPLQPQNQRFPRPREPRLLKRPVLVRRGIELDVEMPQDVC